MSPGSRVHSALWEALPWGSVSEDRACICKSSPSRLVILVWSQDARHGLTRHPRQSFPHVPTCRWDPRVSSGQQSMLCLVAWLSTLPNPGALSWGLTPRGSCPPQQTKVECGGVGVLSSSEISREALLEPAALGGPSTLPGHLSSLSLPFEPPGKTWPLLCSSPLDGPPTLPRWGLLGQSFLKACRGLAPLRCPMHCQRAG